MARLAAGGGRHRRQSCGSACRGRAGDGSRLKDGRILRGRTGETVGLAEQNGAGEADAIKQIVFVNDDFRLTFVSRRQVEALKPDTSLENAEKFELDAAERPDRPQRPAESHRGRPAGGALEGIRRMGPADLSHAHGRRHTERRAGHHRAHAAICQGRGRARDVGHADRHEHALRRVARQDPHAPDQSQEARTTQEDRAFLSPVQALQHGRGDVAADPRGFQGRHAGRPGPSTHAAKAAADVRAADARGVGAAAGRRAARPGAEHPEEVPHGRRDGRNPANRPPGARGIQRVRGQAGGHRQGLRGLAAAGPAACRPRGPGDGAGRDGAGVEPRNAAPHGGLPAEPERPEAQGRGETLAGRQRLVAGVRRGLDRSAGNALGMAAAGHGAEVLDRDAEGQTRPAVALRSLRKPPPSRRCWPRWPPT